MPKRAKLGVMNTLTVTRVESKGYSLDCFYADEDSLNQQHYDSAFLPKEQCGDSLEEGDITEAFVYIDRNNELLATSKTPLAFAGTCADLRVVTVEKFGAFLDIGLDDDLLLPISEQAYPVQEGLKYVVYLHIDDEYGRLIASTKLHHFLDEFPGEKFTVGQNVTATVATQTQLGYKVVIDNRYIGLVFHNELGRPLRFGSSVQAWVKTIREDGKIDLTVTQLDDGARQSLDQQILDHLEKQGGSSNIGDKSSAFEIGRQFSCSKNNFKKALGRLYKQRKILISPEKIELVK